MHKMIRNKWLVIVGMSVVLAGCGQTAGTPVEEQPSTSVETVESVTDDQEPDFSVDIVDDEKNDTDSSQNTEEISVVENPTFVQTGENEYTVYVDCPDNSNAEELTFIPEHDDTYSLDAGSSRFGISENFLNAVMTHGVQVDPLNAAQIKYDAYMDELIEINQLHFGASTYVITNNPSNYSNGVICTTMDDLKYNNVELISGYQYELCAILLQNAINSTNGNITCALTRYNMGPEAWNQAMEECMNATGLTAEQIYANCDATYVLSYATQGLGDPNYANEVLQYIGNEPIVITAIDEYGDKLSSVSYIIDRTGDGGQS